MSTEKEKELRRRIKADQKSRVLATLVPPPLIKEEDEKVYNELCAEASSEEPGGQSNALKHGGYSEHLILPGENREEFELLHQDLIAEWMPSGASEKNAVLALALSYWQERRNNQWYYEEATWLSEHPAFDDIDF